MVALVGRNEEMCLRWYHRDRIEETTDVNGRNEGMVMRRQTVELDDRILGIALIEERKQHLRHRTALRYPGRSVCPPADSFEHWN